MVIRLLRAALVTTLAILPTAAAAQGTLTPWPKPQFADDDNHLVANGKLCVYLAGTSTATTTYSASDLDPSHANTNPITLDASGRPTSGAIYLAPGASYKYVLRKAGSDGTCSTGTIVWTQDNVPAVPASAASVDVQCQAGEALTAGLAVYLSDGSGGKNAGQCYKADSANAYSSTGAIMVGLTPSAISSGALGTVRIAGSVPDLSSLATGSTYYVGTGGAITATAPTNARKIGGADTATSLILTLPPFLPTLPNGTNDFRVSAATTSCFPATDVTAVTTIYLTPCFGHTLALPDAAGTTTLYTSAEISIAVPATTSTAYDVFVYANSGVPTLELLAWTNVTTRATAIVRTTTGFYTKSGDITRRYVASFMTGTVSGQTEDSLPKRYVWNYYNQRLRPMFVSDATGTWNYSANVFHQANANAANQLDFLIGVGESAVPARAVSIAKSTSAVDAVYVGIGLDSTTTPLANSTGQQTGVGVTGTYYSVVGFANPIVTVGRHQLVWLEKTAAAGTSTFQGAANAGISGEIWN